MNLPVAHRVDVLRRGEAFGVLVVVDDAATGENGAQVEIAAQVLAGIVQPPPQAESPVVGIDEHIHAVEGVAFRVMVDAVPSGHQVLVGVLAAEAVVTAAYAERRAHQSAVVLDDDLPLGKVRDQCPDRMLGPGAADVGIDLVHQFLEARVVGHGEIADLQMQIDGAVSGHGTASGGLNSLR